ncbi:MAG: UDP-N-acetylglucosamine 2-epimerase (non-hydrolyzing) [Gemmatimonadales bacterium]|jgi:UDP-N-acetylglucosamine 2-epimerase
MRETLAVCYGTRPQIIKASVLLEELARSWDVLSVDTGQHYDYELNALQYEQLGVRPPQVYLEVGSGDHATQTGAILARAAEVLAQRRPAAAVVVGDTNSTLGCALAAVQLRIPVIHVEAGMRGTDAMMAEEVNRRIVDVISTVLCAPSETAARRLRLEYVAGTVILTGDVARDVLVRNLARVPRAADTTDWPLTPATPFVFATLHRAELTDNADHFAGVVRALGGLDFPVVLAAHPRTGAALERHGLLDQLASSVHLRPPLGYLQSLGCVRDAAAVVTDSGGVQREAYWLGTPCVTVRKETEWEETVRLGANVLVAPAQVAEELAPAVGRQASRTGAARSWDRDAYGTGEAAVRIREAIEQWRTGSPA